MSAFRWRPLRRLGVGGKSSVLLVQDEEAPETLAAYKALRGQASEADKQQLRREAELLAECWHPNIPRLLEYRPAEDALVLEYVEGEELRSLLLRDGPMGVQASLRIAEAVASALGYLHRRGIWHRDVKAANILIRADGQPLLVDLGVSVALTNRRHQDIQNVAGTPRYLPPEVLRMDEVNPTRADLYGLGVVLFEMLTGETAFAVPPGTSVGNILATIAQIKQQTDALDPGDAFPTDLRGLVQCLTASTPERRPPSAAATIDRIHELVSWPTERPETEQLVTTVMPSASRSHSWDGEALGATMPLKALGAILQPGASLPNAQELLTMPLELPSHLRASAGQTDRKRAPPATRSAPPLRERAAAMEDPPRPSAPKEPLLGLPSPHLRAPTPEERRSMRRRPPSLLPAATLGVLAFVMGFAVVWVLVTG